MGRGVVLVVVVVVVVEVLVVVTAVKGRGLLLGFSGGRWGLPLGTIEKGFCVKGSATGGLIEKGFAMLFGLMVTG